MFAMFCSAAVFFIGQAASGQQAITSEARHVWHGLRCPLKGTTDHERQTLANIVPSALPMCGQPPPMAHLMSGMHCCGSCLEPNAFGGSRSYTPGWYSIEGQIAAD